MKENNVEGFPDGMTIDTDGNLWVACYEGSRVILQFYSYQINSFSTYTRSIWYFFFSQVIKINPKSGTLLSTINLPTENITSVAFGGKNLEDLYVTSARFETFKKLGKNDPKAGSVFKIRGTGSRGYPGVPIDIQNIS